MKTHALGRRRAAAGASVLAGLALALAPATPAAAAGGEASAFGATITVGGEEVIPPTPAVQQTAPGDAEDTTIGIPAEPVAVSGTLNAFASIHPAGDLESALEVVEQELPGPYHARSEGLIEGAEVLLDAAGEGVSLVSADVIRAEAVAVCTDGVPTYSATSEIVNLDIGGQDVPLNDPLTQLIDGLNEVLAEDGLGQVASVQRDVVTELDGGGIAVDALVVTVLAAAGDAPLAEVRLGHAQVSGDVCTFAACSDGIDNDDPEDELADAADPGCHTDGDPSNADSYDPTDDDETDAALPGAPAPAPAAPTPAATAELPRTGSDDASTVTLAAVMGAAALGALALRRRLG